MSHKQEIDGANTVTASNVMRKTVVKIVVCLVFLLAVTGLYAQSRSNFEPIAEGFSIARAVEADGRHSLLVKFPDAYLISGEAIDAGIEKVMPLIFGCEYWQPNCEAKITGRSLDEENKTRYVYMDIVMEDKPIRLLVFGLAKDSENSQFAGIVIMVEDRQ